jgi:hypothetical protein
VTAFIIKRSSFVHNSSVHSLPVVLHIRTSGRPNLHTGRRLVIYRHKQLHTSLHFRILPCRISATLNFNFVKTTRNSNERQKVALLFRKRTRRLEPFARLLRINFKFASYWDAWQGSNRWSNGAFSAVHQTNCFAHTHKALPVGKDKHDLHSALFPSFSSYISSHNSM